MEVSHETSTIIPFGKQLIFFCNENTSKLLDLHETSKYICPELSKCIPNDKILNEVHI